MKQIFTLIGLILFSGLTNAQETKNLVIDANAEVRQVEHFDAIEVSGAIDLYLSQGSEEGIAISAGNEETRNRIKTKVEGTTLHIYFDGKGINWRSWGNTKSKAYITFKKLYKLEASGACNVLTTDPVKSADFKIDFSGASDFKGEVNVNNLIISVSGASNVKISGSADNAKLDASGASNIKSYDLITNLCKADASGAANIRITVNKELKASASGASTIYYKGTAVIRDIDSSAGASIKKKSDSE